MRSYVGLECFGILSQGKTVVRRLKMKTDVVLFLFPIIVNEFVFFCSIRLPPPANFKPISLKIQLDKFDISRIFETRISNILFMF